MPAFRQIPSIDLLLQLPDITTLVALHGRPPVVDALRAAADDWRARASDQQTPDEAADAWIAATAARMLGSQTATSLRRVINASGVIIHTNLGRAPLADAATAHATAIARGYSNLEYDLSAGTRGHRHVHAERQLCDLTSASAAVVANNNAAATWLVLAALAAGREVIVSRGELVEIGGGFRVPDIMAQSGATLREVGTTNRTRLSDYAAAINDRTALILRVHPSNFRIEGFTERPDLKALAALADRFHLPLFEDQGSGWLGLPHPGGWPDALRDEPSVRESVAAGVSVVAFSGDKLLGGPQAGIVVGQTALIDQVRRHPMMRAVRADKQTYAALEATLSLWQREPLRTQIPVVRMLLEPLEALERRADALVAHVAGMDATAGLSAAVVEGISTIGGGSAPQSTIPTRPVELRSSRMSASQLEAALRTGSPAVVVRVQHDAVLLDLRTVAPQEDAQLFDAIRAAAGERSSFSI